MSDTKNQQKVSTSELEALKKKQLDFMKEQLPYLKVEEEFTKLQADIASNRMREKMAKIKSAEMSAPQPKEEPQKPKKS